MAQYISKYIYIDVPKSKGTVDISFSILAARYTVLHDADVSRKSDANLRPPDSFMKIQTISCTRIPLQLAHTTTELM